MSNFTLVSDGLSRTMPQMVAAGIIATGLLNSHFPVGEYTAAIPANVRQGVSYVAIQNPDTAAFGGEAAIDILDGRFEAEIASFYDRLLKAQQPLGAEFQAVLSDNLWDLYAD